MAGKLEFAPCCSFTIPVLKPDKTKTMTTVMMEEDDSVVYKWWEVDQMNDAYDSDREGSRPVKQEWPKDSLLTPDHFTIDQQQCLKCKKRLGYAMPMNKQANPKYLFCCEENGTEKCRKQADYLQCWACGNLNTQNTGVIVCKPGNCAYYPQPSQIYEFMCHFCHNDMMKNEPGVEECRAQMKKIREARALEKTLGHPLTSGVNGVPYFHGTGSMPAAYQSTLQGDKFEIPKKRKRSDRKEEKKEACAEQDLMLE